MPNHSSPPSPPSPPSLLASPREKLSWHVHTVLATQIIVHRQISVASARLIQALKDVIRAEGHGSQARLAKELNIGKSMLNDVLKGNRSVSEDLLKKLSKLSTKRIR